MHPNINELDVQIFPVKCISNVFPQILKGRKIL